MTQKSNTIDYRIASRNDETDMYAVIEEVAPEVPVLLDIPQRQAAMRGIIVECHQSGKSWVAVNADGTVVGCALARPDILENGAISLRYVGVSKTSRRQGIFATFIDKLKTNGMPVTVTVLHNNRSAMTARLLKAGFTEVESGDKETKLR